MGNGQGPKVLRAFILSGGGLRGCFQVGAIDHLLSLPDKMPDLVCGISTGSLQALGVSCPRAQGTPKVLHEVWESLKKKKDVYKTPWLKYIAAVPCAIADAIRSGCTKTEMNGSWLRGLYEFGGLKEYVARELQPAVIPSMPIRLIAGAADLKGGELIYFDSKFDHFFPGATAEVWLRTKRLHMARLDSPDQIIASCSIPASFPPVKVGDWQLVDGGARDILPLKVAIEALKQMADEAAPEAELELYLMLCDPVLMAPKAERRNFLSVVFRTVDVVCNETLYNDIITSLKKNALAGQRSPYGGVYRKIKMFAIYPTRPFIDVLEVDQVKIKDGIEHGRQCAPLGLSRELSLDQDGNLVLPY